MFAKGAEKIFFWTKEVSKSMKKLAFRCLIYHNSPPPLNHQKSFSLSAGEGGGVNLKIYTPAKPSLRACLHSSQKLQYTEVANKTMEAPGLFLSLHMLKEL